MEKDPSLDSALTALSPIDGRYRDKLAPLGPYLSEGALINYRIRVEAAWLLHLSQEPTLGSVLSVSESVSKALEELAESPPETAQSDVKKMERKINHDVKAVEYYLRGKLSAAGAGPAVLAFIHFGCTSEDINNLAYALMLKDVRDRQIVPHMAEIISDLAAKTELYAGLPMLGRTHGQAATPTTLGKELAVFARRLHRQQQQFQAHVLEGKMNGAIGAFNAHMVALPDVDWQAVTQRFIEHRLNLRVNPLTTQIENHDSLVEYVDYIRRFNTILVGLCRDFWGYVSLGYLRQKVKNSEVGSSTMPHKVNPIDFENAEGNLGMANAMASHFSDKLLVSRFQRDLSDSTVLRALGSMIGHSQLAYISCLKGLGQVVADRDVIHSDLQDAWEVLAEPVQTVMRRYGVMDAYERLKEATRGRQVNRDVLQKVVEDCDCLPDSAKAYLDQLTPENYLGLSEKLALEFVSSLR